MGGFFTMLFSKLSSLAGWFGTLLVEFFVAFWNFFTDGVCWVFEQMLGLAVSILGSLDVSGISNYTQTWSQLSADVLNVLGLIGMGTCLSIIASAALIRITLQLIPFTRLGS